jgi:pyruvate formate lyase activating enzyme
MDLYKVDLKCFDEDKYRQMTGGKMSRVLGTIEDLIDLDFWVEVVTLVIPGWNDSDLELGAIARFLARVSPDIPWHLTAYHPDYRWEGPPTPPQALRRACEIGKAAGLRFVYAGNAAGLLPGLEDTLCPTCGLCLIERSGFTVLANRLLEGRCPKCASAIPGVWK